jgi:hypothetical protein
MGGAMSHCRRPSARAAYLKVGAGEPGKHQGFCGTKRSVPSERRVVGNAESGRSVRADRSGTSSPGRSFIKGTWCMVVLERPDRLLLLHQLDPSGPAAGYNPVHVFSPTHLRTPSPAQLVSMQYLQVTAFTVAE